MTTYPWKRFWIRRGGELSLADGGYLVDPETQYGEKWNPDILSNESLRDTRCLVLLGEPGVGKTTALRAEIEAVGEEDRLHVDLREFSSESLLVQAIFETPRFIDWRNSTRNLVLFLDSLDECLINVRAVSALLAARFRGLPVDRLQLRIACRTADWPEILASSLPAIWGQANYAEVELAPLRRRDVALAAEVSGKDPKEFLRQVEAHGLVPFAIRPSTLLMILAEYQQGRPLPMTVSELFERGCLELTRERSTSRVASGARGRLAPEQRLGVADQIAAATMFGRRAAIFRGVNVSQANRDDEVLEEQLVWGKVEADGRAVTLDDVREVLGTELFSGRESLRLGWSHWSFPEYLAARFARRVGLSDEQLADLLLRSGVDGRERVIPQLREVAAWLAPERPALLRRIVAGDPQVLLRPALGSVDLAVRGKVALAILDLADQTGLLDREQGLRAHYRVLAQPGLSALLAPYFKDRGRNRVVRRMAIDIAESCGCRDLVPDLLSIALVPDEDPHIRAQAAYAILKLGDESERSQLRPLLDADSQEDPDDELRGVALEALWPRHLGARALFEKWLTLPRNPSLFGAYKAFLLHLPERLNQEHLADALEWVARQSPDHFQASSISDLPASIMKKAWDYLDEPGVLPAFTTAALHRIDQYDPILAQGSGVRREDSALMSDTVKRRRLLAAIIEKLKDRDVGATRHVLHQIYRLIQGSDFEWLLDQYASAGSSAGANWWLELIDRSFDPGRLDHVEALLGRASGDLALHDRMRIWLDPVELHTSEADAMRSRFKEVQRLTQPPGPRPVTHPPLRALIEGWLDRAEAGNVDAWWRLNRDMTLTEDSDHYPYAGDYETDLTTLPGWLALDERGRARVLQAALKYLEVGDPDDAEWLGKNIYHYPAAAGYRAVRLLLKMRQEEIEILSPHLWEKWAASILNYSQQKNGEDDPLGLELVALIHRKAPDAFLKALHALIEKDNREHKTVFMLGKLAKAWDRDLAGALIRKIDDVSLAPATVGILLQEVLVRFPDLAQPVARSLVGRHSDAPSEAARAEIAAAVLLEEMPRESWDEVWPILGDDRVFGRAVIETLATRTGFSETPRLAAELGEASLADLYLWLRREFPGEQGLGSGFVGTLDLITLMRDGILQSLKRRGTDEAVRQLQRITTELPDLQWLRYELLDAEELRLRESWSGVSLGELQRLAASSEVRLVDTEEQLVSIVEASLSRLEARLHGSPPAIGALWNDRPFSQPKAEADLSDYITLHLQDDLRDRAIIANREVELRRGSESDIRVDAVSRRKDGTVGGTLSVIIEVKGCWNRGLQTDMQTQLRDRYLRDTGLSHGLYVVGWFACDAWKEDAERRRRVPNWNLAEARRFFENQAKELSVDGFLLRAAVLDTARK